MLACVLRRSRIDGAKHAAGVIKLLITRLRQAWPQTHFIVRGDSGFCRQRLIRWCERSQVSDVIGMAQNKRLNATVQPWERQLQAQFECTDVKQRMIGEFSYCASSWNKPRRVITRLEYGQRGNNPRYIVSNLDRDASWLYDELYCQRGEAENRIKETQLDLFGTRTSGQKFLTNWMRVMRSALAYALMNRRQDMALKGTDLARATAATVRTRLLKIGPAVIRNTRRIRISLASSLRAKNRGIGASVKFAG